MTCGFPDCEEVLCVKSASASVDHVIDAHYVRSDVVENRVDKFKCDWGDCAKTPTGYDIKRHMLHDGPAKGASSSEPSFSRFPPEAAEGGGGDNDSLRALCSSNSLSMAAGSHREPGVVAGVPEDSGTSLNAVPTCDETVGDASSETSSTEGSQSAASNVLGQRRGRWGRGED